MLDSLLSLIALIAIGLTSFGVGRPVLRVLRIRDDDVLSAAVWSVAVGAIVVGLMLTAMGCVGLLRGPILGVLTAVGAFAGIGEIFRAALQAAERPRARDVQPEEINPANAVLWSPPPRWLTQSLTMAAVLACLGSLLSALAPPTAGDALCYHLELPKTFLANHAIIFSAYSDNSTFPLMTEMWFLWGLAVNGGVCAQLIHWGLGLLLAGGTVELARPMVGRQWAGIAGALALLVPAVNNQMTAPLNDVALAAMTTLALAAWWRAVVTGEGRQWLLIAGLAGGAALGTKYIAVLFALVVAATVLWTLYCQPKRRRDMLVGAVVVSVVALSTAGVWYVRAAWYRGSPVFPFFSEAFEQTETANAPDRETLPKSKAPLGRNPLKLAVAPWQVTMHPEHFGGRGHQLGVLLLAVLPGMAFCRRLRGMRTLLAIGLGYAVFWFFLRQNVRFLLPAVPPLLVAAVWVLIEMRRLPRGPKIVAATAMALALVASTAIPLWRARGEVAVAIGWEDREDYLVRTEPTYTAAAVVNHLLPKDARILSQDYRAFYFERKVTRENVFRRYTQYDQQVTDPAQLSIQLRSAGFTHLLLMEKVDGPGPDSDRTLSRLVEAQAATATADQLQLLTDYRFCDRDGVTRRYRLVALQ